MKIGSVGSGRPPKTTSISQDRNDHMDLPGRPGFGMKLKRGIAVNFPYITGTYWKKNPKLPEV